MGTSAIPVARIKPATGCVTARWSNHGYEDTQKKFLEKVSTTSVMHNPRGNPATPPLVQVFLH
jgi:hypothetical protein